MGYLPRLTSKILSTNTFLGILAKYCLLLQQMSMNTFGYFIICRQTLIFYILEVSRGKYPIIKYTEFLAALHKSSKWELFVVPNNFERLVIYEGKNAGRYCGWSIFMAFQCYAFYVRALSTDTFQSLV